MSARFIPVVLGDFAGEGGDTGGEDPGTPVNISTFTHPEQHCGREWAWRIVASSLSRLGKGCKGCY